jgi:hypothetical protein
MRQGLVAAALLLAFGTAADAAPPSCFSAAEIEAEQAILFQTELMVVADACRDPAYVQFLYRNRDSIVMYQKRMIDRFRRAGERKPENAYDTYATKLANESSLRNGAVPVSTVCEQAAQLLATANGLSNKSFREYAAEKAHNNASFYRHCEVREAAR